MDHHRKPLSTRLLPVNTLEEREFCENQGLEKLIVRGIGWMKDRRRKELVCCVS